MSLRILFVEDHRDTRHVLSNLLRHFGYEVDAAETHAHASLLLDTFDFDVLLCDIGLPDGDGCDLARQAKKQGSVCNIALTAFSSGSDIDRGMEAGFDHYLTKPCDVAMLRKLLGYVVR